MKKLLKDYKGQVGICPSCGKTADIWVVKSVENIGKQGLNWICWHPGEDGKPKAELVAFIYELDENKIKFWAAEGFFLLDKTISELSREHAVDLRKHIHGDGFDFGTWWEEFLSHESSDTLNRLVDMPNNSWLFQAMSERVMGELERRGTVGTR